VGLDWVEVDTLRRLRPGTIVAQVVGHSMEPLLPDEAYCLFAAPVTGSRHARNVLVRLRDEADPETGERYTLKRYESERVTDEEGTWRHTRITLRPLNADDEPIVIDADEEERLQVVEVLG
jgi:hypothetical protein